jgi:hypothetical protein
MRGKSCRSCEGRIDGTPSFCPRCGVPTEFASADERTHYDLANWRRNSLQARDDGAPSPARRIPDSVRAATGQATLDTAPTYGTPHATRRARRPVRSRARAPFARYRKAAAGTDDAAVENGHGVESADIVELDKHDAFAYRACVRCHKVDWLLRTGTSEDGRFRYWCMRCSRSFKSEVRLPHARKPFVVSGSILVALIILANFH